MTMDAVGGRELADAAAVHSARQNVVHAIASLAAQPLDEGAAEQMRAALARASSPSVQQARTRLTTSLQGPRPVLVCIPTAETVPPPPGSDDLTETGQVISDGVA
jgi:hypothetical protein